MQTLTKFILAIGLAIPLVATADTSVYIVAGQGLGPGQFGTLDINTGKFQQRGPTQPEGYFGLVPGPNGSLLSLTYASNLDSIDPVSGVHTQIGATGLTNCFNAVPSCPSTSGFSIGSFNGKTFATDIGGDLYTVNPATAAATLLSNQTGIPASVRVPGSQNPDQTFNFQDEAIWQSGSKLYLTIDEWVFNGTAFPASVLTPAQLFSIDSSTGKATLVGPISGFSGASKNMGIGGAVAVNGISYVFNDVTGQIATLNLVTGAATPIGSFDPSAGVIQGAFATPEPASIAFAALGFALLILLRPLRILLRPRSARVASVVGLLSLVGVGLDAAAIDSVILTPSGSNTDISITGTFDSQAPLTSYSAPDSPFTVSFTVPTAPTSFLLVVPQAQIFELGTTADVNGTFFPNSAAAFFPTAEGGGLSICLEALCGPNYPVKSINFGTFGNQLFTGTFSNPVLISGAARVDDSVLLYAAPEPFSVGLVGLGAMLLVLRRRKRRVTP